MQTVADSKSCLSVLYYKSSGTPDSRGNNKEEEEYKPSQNTDFSDCSLFWIQRGNDGTLN
jgi:hypothetical protein